MVRRPTAGLRQRWKFEGQCVRRMRSCHCFVSGIKALELQIHTELEGKQIRSRGLVNWGEGEGETG